MEISFLHHIRGLFAGMPSASLSTFAANRLELISLFLAGLFASAFVVQGVWNGLLSEFPKLPRLSYKKALVIVFLWGLLFVIVLTMISGARELMTPGAWIKKGSTYSLSSSVPGLPASSRPETYLGECRERLAILGEMLTAYEKQHGTLPIQRAELNLPEKLWDVPHAYGLRYVYHPEVKETTDAEIWLTEPEFFPDARLQLHRDGRIEILPTHAKLEQAREAGE